MGEIRQDPYADRYATGAGVTVSEIRALFAVANRPEVVSLAGGMPAVSALPLDEIAELARGLISKRGAAEGIEAVADDVVVTVGSQHALTHTYLGWVFTLMGKAT